ncbi:Homeobox-leucine zipper protein HOX32 [Platanthera guangdongensis]|uniref:Homeobox-leucine zipper protein HOX32 n=1 Tax=Platanthera guangdongensis TaxID=2320717 RepID=A0ABR2MB06_9ASPA
MWREKVSLIRRLLISWKRSDSLGPLVKCQERGRIQTCVLLHELCYASLILKAHNVPPSLLVQFLREHRSEWANAYSAASLRASPFVVPGMRVGNGFLGSHVNIPLAHTVENAESSFGYVWDSGGRQWETFVVLEAFDFSTVGKVRPELFTKRRPAARRPRAALDSPALTPANSGSRCVGNFFYPLTAGSSGIACRSFGVEFFSE